MLHENGLDAVVCRELGLDVPEPDLTDWRKLVEKITAPKRDVSIAIVGKYVRLPDAYLSVVESLRHAGFETGANVNISWIDSEDVTLGNVDKLLSHINGMIIPGGFGERGVEGKIIACRYAREHDIPFLGICLGMQVSVIEFARNVCGLHDANSREFDEASPHPVIDIMPDQVGRVGSGGTMRLGAYPCKVKEDTLLFTLYGTNEIHERHRHRFEVNNTYRDRLIQGGMTICGTSPDNHLVEAIELPGKRFFVGVQFHPEFKGRPTKPHPLFLGLVQAAVQAGEALQ
jgi:CTP synthase